MTIQGPEAVEFDAGDVCAGAAARGEPQRAAMDAYRAACMKAIRSDPELDAQWRHDAEMAQHAAENTPPSYDRAEMNAWIGGQRRTALEVPFDRARFDDSLELARDQLTFPPPDPEIDDDEMEAGR